MEGKFEWLNSLLYRDALNDVLPCLTGSSLLCVFRCGATVKGWEAREEFVAVMRLGVVWDFGRLLEVWC
jgi:hypothetical protein